MGDAPSREKIESDLLDVPAHHERKVTDSGKAASVGKSRGKPIVKGTPLPPMVFIVNTVMFRGAVTAGMTPVGERVLCALFLDGREVGRNVSYPSQPLKLKFCTTASQLALKCFATSNADTFLREDVTKQLADSEVEPEPSSPGNMESTVRLLAEVSIPLSQLVKYGAPLFSSLWLGLEVNEGNYYAQDFTAALKSSVHPEIPKVHITLFQPDTRKAGKRRELLPDNSTKEVPLEVEPDLQSVFEDESDWLDLCAATHTSGISRVSQLKGLVEAMKLSNQVAYSWQDAINTYTPLALDGAYETQASHAELQVNRPNRELQQENDRLRAALEASDALRQHEGSVQMQQMTSLLRAESLEHKKKVASLQVELSKAHEKVRSTGLTIDDKQGKQSLELVSELTADAERMQKSLYEADMKLLAEQEASGKLREQLSAEQGKSSKLREQLDEVELRGLGHERKRPSTELVSELNTKLAAEQGKCQRLQEQLNALLSTSEEKTSTAGNLTKEVGKLKAALQLAESNLALEQELSTHREQSKRALTASGAELQLQVERLRKELQASDSKAKAEVEVSARLRKRLEDLQESSANQREQLTLAASADQANLQEQLERMRSTLKEAEANVTAEQETSESLRIKMKDFQADARAITAGLQAQLEKAQVELTQRSRQLPEVEEELGDDERTTILTSRGAGLGAELDVEVERLKSSKAASRQASSNSLPSTSLQQPLAGLPAAGVEQAQLREELQRLRSAYEVAESQVSAERELSSSLREQIADMLADAQDTAVSLHEQMQNDFARRVPSCPPPARPVGQGIAELRNDVHQMQRTVKEAPMELSQLRDAHKKILAACAEEASVSRAELQAEIVRLQAALDSLQVMASNFSNETSHPPADEVRPATPFGKQAAGMEKMFSQMKTELQAELSTVRSALEAAELKVAGGAAVEQELKAQLEQMRNASVAEAQRTNVQFTVQHELQTELAELQRSHADLTAQQSKDATDFTKAELQEVQAKLLELQRTHQELQCVEARELDLAEAKIYAERTNTTSLRTQFENAISHLHGHASTSAAQLQLTVGQLQDDLKDVQLKALTEEHEAAAMKEAAQFVYLNEQTECERFIQGTKAFHELQAKTEELQKELQRFSGGKPLKNQGDGARDVHALRLFWRLMCEKYAHLTPEDLEHALKLDSRPATLMRSEVERVINMYKAHQSSFNVERAFQKLDIMGTGCLLSQDFEKRLEQNLSLDSEISGYIFRAMLEYAKCQGSLISKEDFYKVFSQVSTNPNQVTLPIPLRQSSSPLSMGSLPEVPPKVDVARVAVASPVQSVRSPHLSSPSGSPMLFSKSPTMQTRVSLSSPPSRVRNSFGTAYPIEPTAEIRTAKQQALAAPPPQYALPMQQSRSVTPSLRQRQVSHPRLASSPGGSTRDTPEPFRLMSDGYVSSAGASLSLPGTAGSSYSSPPSQGGGSLSVMPGGGSLNVPPRAVMTARPATTRMSLPATTGSMGLSPGRVAIRSPLQNQRRSLG